jgi:acyl-CoA thioesterase YciA
MKPGPKPAGERALTAAEGAAGTRAKGRVARAAASNLGFLQPVNVGDVVCVYTDITKTGGRR